MPTIAVATALLTVVGCGGVMVPTIEAETAAIEKLGAPTGDEEQIESILAAQRAAIDEVEGMKKVASVDEIEGSFAEVSQMPRDYGFEACTNG